MGSEVVECYELAVAARAQDAGVCMGTKLLGLDPATDVAKEGPWYKPVAVVDDNLPRDDDLLDDPDAFPLRPRK